MRSSYRTLALLAALALAVAGSAIATPEVVTLEGTYIWDRDGEQQTGDLKAILTPEEGSDEWTVAFHFIWKDEPRVFEGKASGSTSGGPLEGTAKSDDESHEITFRFWGEVEEGTFTGTHGYFKKDGSLEEGGTLTLERVN